MKTRLVGIVLLLVVGAGALVFALRPSTASGQQSQYLTATVARRTITADAVATGNVAFATTYALSFGSAPTITSTATSSSSSSSSSGSSASASSWTVKQVKVSVGGSVRKGDVLAVASDSGLASQLDVANDQLRSAKNDLANATDRVDALTSSSSTTAVRAAWNALYQARAQVANDQQTIANLDKQLSYATLTAPADGVVTAVNAIVGLPAPSAAAVVIGAAPLEVVGQYAESDLASLAIGQTATVTISATGASVSGKVVAIAPTAATSGGSTSVVTYDVTIQLANPPASVKQGMSANVSITTASASDALAVPAVALSGDGADGYSVEVMGSDGGIQAVPVQVGLVTSAWAQITSGLSAGDVVVTGTTSARQSTTTSGGGIGFPGGLGGFGGGNFRGGGGNGRTGAGAGGGGNVQP